MKAVFSRTGSISRWRGGYTLAEVLVASALVGLALGGAIALSATMNMQNETATTVAAALSMQDNAARLWQLGLTSTECDGILPRTQNNNRLARAVVPSSGNSMTWGTANTVVLPNSMGSVEEIDSTLTIQNPAGGTNRTNVIQVYRPTIR
jgi:prepilin-type N-terminal cleavage/methylation domain-containing protein